MSESIKNASNLSVSENNDSKHFRENVKDDESNNDDLIRDLTSESIVTLDAVVSGNGNVQNTALSEVPAAGNVVSGGGMFIRNSGSIKIIQDAVPGQIKTCPSPASKSDREHDYSEVRRIITPEKSLKIFDKKACTIVKSNSASPLRAPQRRIQTPIQERMVSQVKNINDLKKVTPRVKLISSEPTTLAQLTNPLSTSVLEMKAVVTQEKVKNQLRNYCRTCAGQKLPLVDIFSEKGIQMRLQQQMKHLKEIKTHDNLSTQMCMDCICDLKMSYKFFMQIKKAQVKLQSLSSLLHGNCATPTRTSSEEEKSRPITTIPLTNNPERTSYVARKPENKRSESSNKSLSPTKVAGEPESTTERNDPIASTTTNECEVATESIANLSDDNESIEEFDPDDPSFRSDNCDEEIDSLMDNSENSQARQTEKTQDKQSENPIVPAKTESKIDRKADPNKDANKTVYQYDAKLKAYVKVEPPDDDGYKDDQTETVPAKDKQKIDNKPEAASKDLGKQPNILKRKISIHKDFLGNPVACVKQSDSTLVRSGPKEMKKSKLDIKKPNLDLKNPMLDLKKPLMDIKKPKLDVKNALNVPSENEDGIMYVKVKGTKPNEVLLVKVKKMDKGLDNKKQDEKKKPAEPSLPVEKLLKKLEPSIKKETEFEMERSKELDMRERKIAEQIEEYKKRREKILGGSSGTPNALKFEDGTIRFVNPVEKSPTPVDNAPRMKIEPVDDIDDIRHFIGSPKSQRIKEDTNKAKDDDSEAYDNAGEYLTRLAKLKKKWEEAKKKKENLKREISESYTEGNMEKLSRVLGEREKNLADFQSYLKQRKIIINRLTDEDVISLYEDRNNATSKKNFPDLIDATEPLDYIAEEDYLECDYCPETFSLRDVLEEHLKSHDYKLMYWCEDCHLEFPTVKTKRAHNAECINKLTCRYCQIVLDSKGKKRQHEQKHVDNMYGQMCDVCGEKFKHQATLDQHFKTQHMTWEKIYQCTKCPKKFAFKQKLTFHMKSVHTTLRAWLCEDCGADFKNPASLRHHRIRKHHPTGNKRECQVCHKLVPFYSLSKHMYTHKAYTIQCPHCDKMFKNSSTLKQHVRIHEDQRQYRCDTCGVGFNRRDGLRLHMRVHQKSDSRSLKECSCQICSEKFPNHSMLVIHRNRVHKDGRQYTCHICNRSMLSTRSLEWHMSHIHNETIPGGIKSEAETQPEKKRVSCVHCDKTFKTEMILRTHIKNTHIEKNPTKCLDCDEMFTSDVRLRHHMMIAHNRLEGTLTCPHCPKRFVNQLRLKTHMISHSEDRPYTCEICGFNLKTKIQLIKHHQNRHSDERPLQCRYCPWRCKQVSALVCHERTHTNERPYSCIVCRQRFKYLGDKNKHERRHESLGGSGFKRIVAGRNVKQSKLQTEETSTSEQEQIDYENQDEEEQLIEEQQSEEYNDDKYTEEEIVKFESEDIGEEYEQNYEQEYEETSREASDAAEVIMNMEDTTVYTEEVTADNIETAEMITDEMIAGDMLQPDITVVHLQQQDDSGKIQVIPVMLSLPDLSDSSAEVNLATASIMYNN
ncbi:uncharacterized protein [Venturia canescens]|uniref:uncharacterized protein n=1 Tax=Venturia canescens TaxID=32260 RepID=UPI001C9C0B3B|nr:uncharacterized protein LOC122412733 [Venturia canescens]XP_043278453.1 uncharacterized protein LOC122412733 [Venturia canescens]XP_043278454.1 uncharacterized protein LOC122412733 [Venturia canescens]XP_043278455.1 uncharacterized protein LOC122412733 [Venturia canescens]